MLMAVCDRCKAPIGAPSDQFAKTASSFGAHVVRMGWVKEKHMCDRCWDEWLVIMQAFFK